MERIMFCNSVMQVTKDSKTGQVCHNILSQTVTLK